jgi:hypothetical protein
MIAGRAFVKSFKTLSSAVVLLCLAACVTNRQIHPIDVNSIGAVQANIKEQVGIYMATVANLPRAAPGKPTDGPVVLINDVPTRIASSDFLCGPTPP